MIQEWVKGNKIFDGLEINPPQLLCLRPKFPINNRREIIRNLNQR